MGHLFVRSEGPADWRRFLAKPETQWVRGKSAFEVAVSWERASRLPSGIPAEISELFARDNALAGASLLLGIVEHKVALRGGSRSSQNDLWALLSAPCGLVSLAVEAKAGESFASTVAEWLKTPDPNTRKKERLDYLAQELGITEEIPGELRYQLFHRTASALLEAKRFRATSAVMLVQSFTRDEMSLGDFRRFSQFLGKEVGEDSLVEVRTINGIRLWLGWRFSKTATDSQVGELLVQQNPVSMRS